MLRRGTRKTAHCVKSILGCSGRTCCRGCAKCCKGCWGYLKEYVILKIVGALVSVVFLVSLIFIPSATEAYLSLFKTGIAFTRGSVLHGMDGITYVRAIFTEATASPTTSPTFQPSAIVSG
jgi:hypothetical protein